MRRNVIMLGTSPNTKGGISSVVRNYEAGGLMAKWPIEYRVTHEEGSVLRKLLSALSAWLWFVSRLARRQDMLLHVHAASRASFWRKSAFILPAIWAGKPVIFHLHGGGFSQFYESDCGNIRKRWVRYVLDHCAKIVVLSKSWKQAIESMTRNRSIEVIVNPAMPAPIMLRPETRSRSSLLFVGRLVQAKGIYTLLDALVTVSRRHPDVQLVCAGEGELDHVEQVAERLGVRERVHLLGWVDEARRAELLSAASIYVMPSFVEGLPMSLLEAMSAGLPIVTTPVGGIPEAITEGEEGFLVPEGNPGALADAICRLLQDIRLQESMGSRALARFNDGFSISVVLPRIEAMYREFGVFPRTEP